MHIHILFGKQWMGTQGLRGMLALNLMSIESLLCVYLCLWEWKVGGVGAESVGVGVLQAG